MIIVCPNCGGSASLEAWLNDRDWRDLVALIPRVPAQLQVRAISYLGLFRSGSRSLKPAKACKVLIGLLDLVEPGTVHWDRGETRPAPLELWAQALDAVIDRRPTALSNHNYLKHTAWEMAGPLAAKAENMVSRGSAENAEERQVEKKPRQRGCFTCGSFTPPKGCKTGHRPVSGNLMLGCGDGWTEKTASVGCLMEGLAEAIKGIPAGGEGEG
jgi:hypothetical protein